jgi:hypothetical protein
MWPKQPRRGATAHTGFIAQNVYLYCASQELATGYGLRSPEQRMVLAPTVAYPDGR